jgi:serine phosphatase RsbU (regulator of sigma subunit)
VAPHHILIAAAARPHPTELVSGDAWHVDWYAAGCRLAVVDGLGHGPDAAAAAARAVQILVASPQASPGEALRLCHDALRGTRGAAVGIATVESAIGRLTYAGVGNIGARLIAGGRALRLPSSRGIVGAILPTIRPFHAALEAGWLLLLHSDGVSDRFDVGEGPPGDACDLQRLADSTLAHWGRSTDDATVVAARLAPTVA